MVAELRIETGGGDPIAVAIDERPVVLGRSADSDLQVADQRLSRHHCRIELTGRKLIVTDLGSSNGTFARGQRVSKIALDPGEAFFVGKTRVTFSVPSAGHAPAPALAAVRAPASFAAQAEPPTRRATPTPVPAVPAAASAAAAPVAVAAHAAPPQVPPTLAVPRNQVPAPPPAVGPGSRDTHAAEPSQIEGYQIFDRLGEGSMGTIYTARSLETGEICVLKTVKFEGSVKEAIFFIREAQMGIRLRHPNIIQVVDFGEAGGTLFLAMEYVDGGSLLDRIKRGGPIGNREALEHLVQLADALVYAGRKKFIHRDIKPANILLTRDGIPKLADFGLAKMMAVRGEAAFTKVGETRGTPIYMPPELLSNAADADSRADVYSLGATYYHALSGFHPFRANSVIEILRMVVEVDPQPIEQRNPNVHPALTAIIRRMMRKRREDRFQGPQELAEELQRIAPEIPQDPSPS